MVREWEGLFIPADRVSVKRSIDKYQTDAHHHDANSQGGQSKIQAGAGPTVDWAEVHVKLYQAQIKLGRDLA